MTLFINSMPVTSVVRVWDVILMEGDKCLLRFALALLDLHKEELMRIEDDVCSSVQVCILRMNKN